LKPPASPAQSLPRGIRFAAVLCLILSGLTGFSALQGAMRLSQLSALKDEASNEARFSKQGTQEEKSARFIEAQFAALEPLRDARTLVLGALSVACAFVFVSASRLLQPEGLPLERVRRLLGGAAIITALLRTIDGAQEAAVARHLAPAFADFLLSQPDLFKAPPGFDLKAVMPTLLLLLTTGMTAAIAGTFALLGQYFRSERVREVVLAQDGQLPEVEEED
jgi:hypothetical protein